MLAHCRLVPHLASTGRALDTIRVTLQRDPPRWVLRYELRGDIGGLELPPPEAPLDPLRLWEHTCFELFARQPGTPRYVEWNFSPAMQQSRFVFARYRERLSASAEAGATLSFERGPRSLALSVTGPLPLTPSTRVAPCVIAKERSGRVAFWALAHAGVRPDFHAAETFRPLASLGAEHEGAQQSGALAASSAQVASASKGPWRSGS